MTLGIQSSSYSAPKQQLGFGVKISVSRSVRRKLAKHFTLKSAQEFAAAIDNEAKKPDMIKAKIIRFSSYAKRIFRLPKPVIKTGGIKKCIGIAGDDFLFSPAKFVEEIAREARERNNILVAEKQKKSIIGRLI